MRWIAVLLIVTVPALAAAVGTVRVTAEVSVESTQIRLGEIASFEGLSREQSAQLARIPLGSAAAPARLRNLSRQALEIILREAAPEVELIAPPEIHIHTAYREIDPEYLRDRFEQALRQRMPWDPEKVRLSDWRLPSRFAVSVGAQRLLVRFRPGEDFIGRVTVQMELLDPTDPALQPIQRSAAVDVTVRSPVLVPTRRLRRGEILDAGAVRVEERELRSLSRGTLTELDQVLGRRLKRAASEGTPLRLAQLETEPLIRRGDLVIVYAGSPGLEVRIEGRALEAGIQGQLIEIENRGTRRRFIAQITAPGSARLPLPDVGAAR